MKESRRVVLWFARGLYAMLPTRQLQLCAAVDLISVAKHDKMWLGNHYTLFLSSFVLFLFSLHTHTHSHTHTRLASLFFACSHLAVVSRGSQRLFLPWLACRFHVSNTWFTRYIVSSFSDKLNGEAELGEILCREKCECENFQTLQIESIVAFIHCIHAFLVVTGLISLIAHEMHH